MAGNGPVRAIGVAVDMRTSPQRHSATPAAHLMLGAPDRRHTLRPAQSSKHRPGMFFRLAPVLLLGVALLGVSSAATAQSPSVRAALEGFARDLGQTADSEALRALEARFGGRGASPEQESLRRMHRGLVRLRLGETGDAGKVDAAAEDFDRARHLTPAWSEAHYAYGLARYAAYRQLAADPLHLGTRVGYGALEDAEDAFVRALAADPTNQPALRSLAQTSRQLHDTTRLAESVLPGLRAARAAGVADTLLLLLLGRTERLMGDSTAADRAHRDYVRAAPSGLSYREAAWSAFQAGDPAGDSLYYAGAVLEDSAGVAAYREDLALIAPDSALVEFDAIGGPDRGAMLRRFWTARDREDLRPDGSRLREHYRRLSIAERRFGLEVNRRYYSDSDIYRSGSSRFDDRGIVFLRYGEPDRRIVTVTFNIQPNESWLYRRSDGDLLVHFAANAGGDIHDLRLIPTVLAIGGLRDPAQGDELPIVLGERCELLETYCKLLGWGPYGRARALADERRLVAASTGILTTTDDHELRFARGIGGRVAALAIGAAGNRSLVHLTWVLPVDDPSPDGRVARPLRVRLALLPLDGGDPVALDTVVEAEVRRDGGGATATGRAALAVPAGRWRVRAALALDDSTGRVFPTDSVTAPPVDGRTLAVSDLALSGPGRGVAWSPEASDTAYLSPFFEWRRSDTLSLYHEIYGLAPGSRYLGELRVRRGRRVVLSLADAGEGADGPTRVTRTLSLARLRPGAYTIEIVITDERGRVARRSRALQVTDPGR